MQASNNSYELDGCLDVLRRGGTILYPTDTIWGIGCDATQVRAVEKIYKIKQRLSEKSLIILLPDAESLAEYVEEVPEVALDLMESITDPLTIIYPGARKLAKNVMASDGSIAIRIPRDDFCQALLKAFGRPLTSTSANISGSQAPLSFSRINQEVKDAVDYIVPYRQRNISRARPSSMIRIGLKGEIQILRS